MPLVMTSAPDQPPLPRSLGRRSRLRELRARLRWRQPEMAEFLGLSQPAVSAVENGQGESGPVSRLVDMLEAAVEAGRIGDGVTPSDARTILMVGLSPASGDDGGKP